MEFDPPRPKKKWTDGMQCSLIFINSPNISLLLCPSTEHRLKACMWLQEISSCSCLTFLPGPAWLLLNKICTPFIRSLYTRQSNIMRKIVLSSGLACEPCNRDAVFCTTSSCRQCFRFRSDLSHPQIDIEPAVKAPLVAQHEQIGRTAEEARGQDDGGDIKIGHLLGLGNSVARRWVTFANDSRHSHCHRQ